MPGAERRNKHDQLFKQLLKARLVDLVQMVAPGIAARLDFAHAELIDRELFSELVGGDRREVDLLARIPTRAGDGHECILVHTEVEAGWRSGTAERIWNYYLHIRVAYDLPVLPIVLYLSGGRAGVRVEEHHEKLWEFAVATFRYCALAVAGCRAEDYLARPEPLAWALTPLMRMQELRPAEHLLACYRRIAAAPIEHRQRRLLINCVRTYLKLEGRDREEFEAMTAIQRAQLVLSEDAPTWEDEVKDEGRREGARELLRAQLEQRFGPLPEASRRRLEAIESSDELTRLAQLVLSASSLAELGLDDAPERTG